MTAAEDHRRAPGNHASLTLVNAGERRNGAWADRALCKTEGDPDDFHPEVGLGKPGAAGMAAYERAKAVCARCPVAWPCLAEHRHEIWGVWGGTTPQERDVLKDPNHGWVGPKPGNPLARNAGGPRNARATG